MPRFVILEHDFPVLHWDLMLENQGTLKTWRLARPPSPDGEPIPATPLGDHRLAYLDYEGLVSGNRGHVKKWDEGEYAGTLEERWRLQLHGKRLRATAIIEDTREGLQVRFGEWGD